MSSQRARTQYVVARTNHARATPSSSWCAPRAEIDGPGLGFAAQSASTDRPVMMSTVRESSGARNPRSSRPDMPLRPASFEEELGSLPVDAGLREAPPAAGSREAQMLRARFEQSRSRARADRGGRACRRASCAPPAPPGRAARRHAGAPRRRRRRSELGAVAVGLLEVVAEDLVQLDELPRRAARASRRSARAARRASPSAERLVGGVADSRWRKRKASSPASCGRRAGRAPCARARSRRVVDLRLLRARAPATAPRWKTSPSTEPRSSTSRSAGSSWSSRAASSAWIVGGTATSPPLDSAQHREHLLDEERVAVGGSAIRAAASSSSLARDRLVDQLVRLLVGERLEQHGRRVELAAAPGRPAVEQLGPGHAEEQDRRVAREVGDVLDQVEERRLAPVDVVEDARRAAARRDVPRAACGTPRRSRRREAAPSTSSPSIERRAPPRPHRPSGSRRAASRPRRPASR